MKDKDIAKEWYWGEAGVYEMPLCPSCREVTYSKERCPFCNQLLKDPENIKRKSDNEK